MIKESGIYLRLIPVYQAGLVLQKQMALVSYKLIITYALRTHHYLMPAYNALKQAIHA